MALVALANYPIAQDNRACAVAALHGNPAEMPTHTTITTTTPTTIVSSTTKASGQACPLIAALAIGVIGATRGSGQRK